MGNAYKSSIPMQSKKIKLGHSSYLPSCSSNSSSNIEIDYPVVMNSEVISPYKKSSNIKISEAESMLNP